jgi:hypothetical protein
MRHRRGNRIEWEDLGHEEQEGRDKMLCCTALAEIISESPITSASGSAHRDNAHPYGTIYPFCLIAPRTSHHAPGLVLLVFPFSSPLFLHILFALASGPRLFDSMKILTRVTVKPKPTTKAGIGAVRALHPGLASTNVSRVPQYAIPSYRQPACEFVSPFSGSPPVYSSHNKDTRGRDEDGGFSNGTNPSDNHDPSHSIYPRKDERHNFTRVIGIFLLPSLTWQRHSVSKFFFSLLGYLTATSAEDPALVRYVCNRASATEANAKEATQALCREFKYVLGDFKFSRQCFV